MNSSENDDIKMSNKKYRIIFDKIEYIEYKIDELIDDISKLQASFRQVKIETSIVKEYLKCDLIN